jgi:hypothetical protein
VVRRPRLLTAAQGLATDTAVPVACQATSSERTVVTPDTSSNGAQSSLSSNGAYAVSPQSQRHEGNGAGTSNSVAGVSGALSGAAPLSSEYHEKVKLLLLSAPFISVTSSQNGVRGSACLAGIFCVPDSCRATHAPPCCCRLQGALPLHVPPPQKKKKFYPCRSQLLVWKPSCANSHGGWAPNSFQRGQSCSLPCRPKHLGVGWTRARRVSWRLAPKSG